MEISQKKNGEKINENNTVQPRFFRSQFFTGTTGRIIRIFLVIIIAVGAFHLGELVGIRKAEFSSHWSQNFYKNFGGEREIFHSFTGDDLENGNGTVGTIVSIQTKDPQTIVVKDAKGLEKIISIQSDTTFRRLGGLMSLSDLQIGDLIVVVGFPDNSGKIKAELVRYLPQASGLNTATSSMMIP